MPRRVARELTQASVFVSSVPHGEQLQHVVRGAACRRALCRLLCRRDGDDGRPWFRSAACPGRRCLSELAGALLSLLNDPDEAARLGERGRALATVRHDRERIRAQILSIYEEMLG